MCILEYELEKTHSHFGYWLGTQKHIALALRLIRLRWIYQNASHFANMQNVIQNSCLNRTDKHEYKKNLNTEGINRQQPPTDVIH